MKTKRITLIGLCFALAMLASLYGCGGGGGGSTTPNGTTGGATSGGGTTAGATSGGTTTGGATSGGTTSGTTTSGGTTSGTTTSGGTTSGTTSGTTTGGGATSGTTTGGAAAATVNVVNSASAPMGFAFTSPITVKSGTSVTWVNQSGAPHSIVWDSRSPVSSPAPGSGIGIFSAGASSAAWTAPAVTVSTTYNYHCGIHGPTMNGQIIVTP